VSNKEQDETTMERVEIREVEGFGSAVVARADLVPESVGMEVFREEALIIFPPHNPALSPPWGRSRRELPERCWQDYLHFLEQPDDVQEKVLSFYADMECGDALRVREFVKSYIETPKSAELFTRLCMVIKFNTVAIQPVSEDGSGPGRDYGHGLFEVACRMAHSCRPNCVWFSFSQDHRFKNVRAIASIKAGEMLTINYLGPKTLEKPMLLRRAELKRVKNFDCNCERCVGAALPGDDSRSFRCHNKRCNGYHLVKQVKEDDDPVLVGCNVCSEAPPAKYTEQMLDNEEKTRSAINYVDRVADYGLPVDVTRSIQLLKPPCERHGVAIQIYQAQSELYEQQGRLAQAILVQRKLINCRLRIHGEEYLDEQTGFQYERLGHLLVDDGDWPGAQKVYQRAVQALQIARGGSDEPYSQCAINKLISVQKRLLVVSPPTVSSAKCGLCGVSASKKCSRCLIPVYCSKDHQSCHWKVHKKLCNTS
jgi:hypothetical protein